MVLVVKINEKEERHYRVTRSEIGHRKLFLIMQSVIDKNNWGSWQLRRDGNVKQCNVKAWDWGIKGFKIILGPVIKYVSQI
jgi:hypothetical protein